MSITFTPGAVLVTGGAGFIGSNFIHHFMAGNPGCRLVNLDVLTYAGNLKNLTAVEHDPCYRFVRGDIGDRELVAEILRTERIDALVHFAAESHVDRSITGPEIFVRTNVLGTQVLLEESRKHWQSGKVADFRYLQVSTDEVYGSLGATGYFTEETPISPNSPYSASKAGADLLVRAYRETFGMPIVAGETTELDIVRKGEPITVEMRVTETEWDGKPAGYVGCRPAGERAGRVDLIGVDATAQGHGLGRDLICLCTSISYELATQSYLQQSLVQSDSWSANTSAPSASG